MVLTPGTDPPKTIKWDLLPSGLVLSIEENGTGVNINVVGELISKGLAGSLPME